MGLYGISLRPPDFKLVLIHWNFIQILLSGFNWRYFISIETSLVGTSIPQIDIAFCVIGLFMYVFVASVIMYWPYRYGEMMLPKHSRNRLVVGTMLLYFSHVLPVWIIEFGIAFDYGWFSTIQGASLVVITISWIFDTLAVWIAYTWYMSSFINNSYGNTVFGRGGL